MDPNCIYETCLSYENGEPCGTVSGMKNGFCQDHQMWVDNIGYFDDEDKAYVVKRVGPLLKQCEDAIGIKAKADVCREIFDFLCKHKRFVYRHRKFQNAVCAKLYEFAEEQKPEIFDAKPYLMELFPIVYGKSTQDLSSENLDDMIDTMDGYSQQRKQLRDMMNIHAKNKQMGEIRLMDSVVDKNAEQQEEEQQEEEQQEEEQVHTKPPILVVTI